MTLILDEATAASAEANATSSLENHLALSDDSMDARMAAARASETRRETLGAWRWTGCTKTGAKRLRDCVH